MPSFVDRYMLNPPIDTVKPKKFLQKNLKSVGMTLAKVKEQDGMTLAKVRHAQVSHAPR